MEIDVPKICGEDLVSRASGRKLREFILEHWDEKILVLNFKDKWIGSVSFFDEAIALLLKKENKNKDEISKKISFSNFRKEDRDLLNYVFLTRVKELKVRSIKK